MCKKLHESAVQKILIFTVDSPYKKGQPGYVAVDCPSSGDVTYTRDIWRAMVWDSRENLKIALPGLKARAGKRELYTHAAVAQLVTPE